MTSFRKTIHLSQFHNQTSSFKIRTRLISTPGGRFPRAWLQPPRHYAPAGSSAQAIPAGVAALRSNQRE